MLSVVACLFYISIASANPCGGDFEEFARAVISSDPNEAYKELSEVADANSDNGCVVGSDNCDDCYGRGECVFPICSRPPPCDVPAFPMANLSQMKVITPSTFTKAAYETQKLVAYLECLSRGAQHNHVSTAISHLLDNARIYSTIFTNNLNMFCQHKNFAARVVLRINEAILSALSNLARTTKSLHYRMQSLGDCMGQDRASSLIQRTSNTYCRLLGLLLNKVMRYLGSAKEIVPTDQVLLSAEEIATFSLELSRVTADFLMSHSKCNAAQTLASIKAFTTELECLSKMSDELCDSNTVAMKTALALMKHGMTVFTYETKLNASDNYAGCGRFTCDKMNYAHALASVYKEKHATLRSISKYTEKSVKEMLAKVVLEDVLLLEVATKSISKENRTQKLALDLHNKTNGIYSIIYNHLKRHSEFSKNSVPELLRLVNETTVYANNLLQLVIHENLEDVDYESGLGILQAMLGEIPRDGVVNLGKQSAIIKVLISATRYSWKRENGAFEKHFATYKPLMRAIVGVAQKLENARNEMNSLSSESFEDFVEQIVTASDLTRDICRVQHNCSAKTEQFVVLCSTHIFQTLRLLLTYYPKTISADVYVSKVSELISEETALLRSLVNGPLALPKKVILMTKGSLRAFHKELYNHEVYGQEARQKYESILASIPVMQNEVDVALTNVLHTMKVLTSLVRRT